MAALDDLLQHPALWRARDQVGSAQPVGLPTGFAELDRCLPGNGWPRKGLIEILADQHGIGELSLLIPALATLCAEPDGGWLAWVSPPYQPYAPALAASRIDVRRVLVVRAQQAIWAMEQALHSGACSAVLGWTALHEVKILRRLQLAAEQSQCLAVLFRPPGDRSIPSPAVLRLALEVGRKGLRVHVIKSRGGRPISVQLGSLAGVYADADPTFAY
jgi:hypothetical protein